MLEGTKTYVLGLQTKVTKIRYHRNIELGDIKQYRKDGTRIQGRIQTKILNSPARKMERLFNCIPGHIRDNTGRPTGHFKKQLDKWLKEVPDQPKYGVYAGWAVRACNSINVQYLVRNRRSN